MNVAFAAISFTLGIAYLALAMLVIVEVRRERRTPGHLPVRPGLRRHGAELRAAPVHPRLRSLDGSDVNWIVIAAVLAGLPAAVAFVGLRVEAMAGGRGDRHVHGTPGWVVAAAVGFCLAAGGLCTAALIRLADGHSLTLLAAVPNLFVTVTYATVGVLLLRTQYLRRPSLGGWSLSGLSLSAIFPSCALMHLV